MIEGDVILIGNTDVRHRNQPGKIVLETPLASPSSLIAIGAGAAAALAAPGVISTRVIAIGDGALDVALAAAVDNIAIGDGAGGVATTITGNVLIGTSAGAGLTDLAGGGGYDNVFIGLRAGAAGTLQAEGVCIGVDAGAAGPSLAQSGDVLIGARAGNSANTQRSIAIGWEAGMTGGLTHSVAIGEGAAGYYTTVLDSSVVIGVNAGSNGLAAPIRVTIVGDSAGGSLTDLGINSTFVGFRAGNVVTDGEGNVLLGHLAGTRVTTSPWNVIAGTAEVGSLPTGPITGAGFNVILGCYSPTAVQILAETPATGTEYIVIAAGQSLCVVDPSRHSVWLGSEKPGNWRTGTGDLNVGIGTRALDANTTGTRNVAVGSDALGVATLGSDNVAVGHQALLGAAGSEAVVRNVALGVFALNDVTAAAAENVVVGYNAATNVTDLQNSVVLGARAFDAATGGTTDRAVLIGHNAVGNAATAAPIDGVIIGYQADIAATTGVGSTILGASSAPAHTTGDYNTLIGFGVVPILTTGDYNVVIGAFVAGTATAANLPAAGSGGYIVIAAHTEGEATGDQIVVVTPGNVYIGADRPGNWLTSTGGDNVAIGRVALGSVTDGENNTVVGAGCGTSITTGDGNILIGNPAHIADTPAVGTINHLNIGAVIFGDLATPAIRIGGSGTVTGQLALLALVSANDDSEQILSLETTGANGAEVRSFVGTRNPDATVSGNPGDLYIRKSGTSSELFQNVGAAAANTIWQVLGGGSLQLSRVTVLTGAGNHVVGNKTRGLVVEGVGGGGGGGGAGGNVAAAAAGAGGGAGAQGFAALTTAPSATYAYSCGAAGTGGAAGNNAGAAGGNTVFDSGAVSGGPYTWPGGSGGSGGAAGTPLVFYAGGAGGTAPTLTGGITGAGGGGDHGMAGIQLGTGAGQLLSGAGASATNQGAGGASRTTTGGGNAATGFGAGGGGGAQTTTAAGQTGGDASAGRLIVWEYQ